MMGRNLTILLILIGNAAFGTSHPGEFLRDWKKMNSFYSSLDDYAFSMEIEVMFNGTSHSRVSMESTVSDTNSFSVIDGGTRSVNGPKFSMTIDPDEKLLTLSRRSGAMAGLKSGLSMMADTGFIVDSIGLEGPVRKYRLKYGTGAVDWIEMSIDTAKGLVSRYAVQYRYAEEFDWRKSGRKLVIVSIRDFRVLDNVDKTLFDEGTYVKKKGREYVALPPYGNYTVLNMNATKKR